MTSRGSVNFSSRISWESSERATFNLIFSGMAVYMDAKILNEKIKAYEIIMSSKLFCSTSIKVCFASINVE